MCQLISYGFIKLIQWERRLFEANEWTKWASRCSREGERNWLCLITWVVNERIAVTSLKAATAKLKKIIMEEHIYDFE